MVPGRRTGCLILVFGKRMDNPDICLTGMVFPMSFTLVGAEHQLRRFIALRPKDEQEDRSIFFKICSCSSSGIDQALGLLLSRALSS
jgi:hypothetical protein